MSKTDYNFNKDILLNESFDDKQGEEVLLRPINQETIKLDTVNNGFNEEKFKLVFRSGSEGVSSKDINKHRKKYVVIGIIVVITLVVAIAIVALLTLKKSQQNPCLQQACGKEKAQYSKTITPSSISSSSSSSSKRTVTIENRSEQVCETERCKLLADNLKKSINFSVEPCDNFHEFACGLWPVTHPIPPSEAKLDTMGLLNLNKNIALRDIIEKQKNQSSGDGFKAKIFRFYKSCMNLPLVESLGISPLKNLLSKFGKWSPVKSSATPDNDITALLIQSHKYFTPSVYDDTIQSPLFKSIVKVNDIDSSKHILEV